MIITSRLYYLGFWWGGKPTQFKSLWKMAYDRLTYTHGLNNLIWVWGPNAPQYTNARPYASYYPGSGYVDVLSADIYKNGAGTDYKASYYTELVTLANGKPIALGETGDMPSPSVLSSQPKWTFFMQWNSTWLRGENTDTQIRDMYNSTRTVKAGQLK